MSKIIINKVEYPIRYSYGALKGFMIESGLTFEDFESKMMLHMDTLLFHGLKAGYKEEEKEFDLTREQTDKFLEDDISLIQDISELFASDLAKMEKKKKPQKAAK